MKRILYALLTLLGPLTGLAQLPTSSTTVPGVVVDSSPDPQRVFIGSPSLAILSDGSYMASHDLFGPGPGKGNTLIFRSNDRGTTWQRTAELTGQFWSTLFVHQNALYILGNRGEYGPPVIRKSLDGGTTWTNPADSLSGVLRSGDHHCAPVPVVVHKGRIWRAMEQVQGRDWPFNFRACVLSAPVAADLLRAGSWTWTNALPFDTTLVNADKPGWLEGNVVIAPDGRLVEIMRFNTFNGPSVSPEFTNGPVGMPRYEVATMLTISDNGKRLSFDPKTGFIHFPGSESKFTIRYDSVSKRYWSLVQKITNRQSGKTVKTMPSHQRNVLMLTSSADLRNWREDCIILRYREGEALTDNDKVGFQYVDWQVDGADLVAICRTAWGNARNYHDANYLTFHRVRNFRRLTMRDSMPPLTQP